MRRLVAGVDSSTQSCKVVVRDADSGELLRQGRAAHLPGTEVDPEMWWETFTHASAAAGGLDDVAVTSIGGQQHGMVCLDERGRTVRPALLWNDTRSARQADALVAELGAAAWADACGSVPVAALTVSKLRWLADHEPDALERTAAVCLPHDWLTWRLAGSSELADLVTDRSDASGTGYWSPHTGTYRTDLLEVACGRTVHLPRVLEPTARAFDQLGAGAGDNAAAALGLDAMPGDIVVSLGTSGVVSAVSPVPTADASGVVAGFADATGHFLPLVCTLNAGRVLEAAARLLGVDLTALSDLALSVDDTEGLVLVPYLEGERTPNRPDATASIVGMTPDNTTPAHLARAALEGLLCGLADALDALTGQGVAAERILLVGGASRLDAIGIVAPAILGRSVHVPQPAEYVADGAARQAAWALTGERPVWSTGVGVDRDALATPWVRERYATVRDMTANRIDR